MRSIRHVFASLSAIGAVVCMAVPTAAEQDGVLARALRALDASGVGYVAVRYLHAGARDGKHVAWMEVETRRGGQGLEYAILGEGGSERTREKVFREVLDTEARGISAGLPSPLSAANYHFGLEGSANGFSTLRLTPKRKDPRLVDGVLTIGPDGHPVSLEGRLAKSPSFWVRSVTVLTRYARFGSVSLPVSVESMANVRFVGPCTFSMRYEYRHMNGHAVHASNEPQKPSGPSQRLLALHALYGNHHQ